MFVTCIRCGESKPIEDFREYGSHRKGRYKYCKECQKIEGRYKYLLKLKGNLTPKQRVDKQRIEDLYAAQEACGLSVPKIYGNNTDEDYIAKMLNKFKGGDQGEKV